MSTFNMHEAKTQLSALVERARKGERIIIAKAGEPCVELVPVRKNLKPRVSGGYEGQIWTAPDWDAPDPELIASFEDGPVFPPENEPAGGEDAK